MQIRGVAEATEGARLRAATATTPRAIKDSVFQIETKQQQQQKSRGILLAPPRTGQTVADLGPQYRSPFFGFFFVVSLSLFTFFVTPHSTTIFDVFFSACANTNTLIFFCDSFRRRGSLADDRSRTFSLSLSLSLSRKQQHRMRRRVVNDSKPVDRAEGGCSS